MVVRRTESQIPGGMANISRLSDRVDVQGSVALVSYLPETIKYVPSKRELAQNMYVVLFDDPDQTGADVTFTWRAKLFMEGQVQPFLISPPEGEDGLFELSYETTREVWCIHKVNRLTVEVDLNPGTTLTLNHKIEPAKSDVDHLERQNVNPDPSSGRPFITKLIEASLAYYLDKLAELDPVAGTQGNKLKSKVVAAIIYNTYVQFYTRQTPDKYAIMNNGAGWLSYLNQERAAQAGWVELPEQDPKAYKSVGVCGIRPEILAMFLKDDYTPGDPPLLELVRRQDEDQKNYNMDIAGNIAALIEDTGAGEVDIGVDLFNLLRFPKSGIQLCSLLLEAIKSTREIWRDRNWDSLVSERDGQLMMLLEDFFHGPSTLTTPSMPVPADVVKRLSSSYVNMLASEDFCQRMRGEFYVGIPDGQSLTAQFLDLFERANMVQVTASDGLTMLHMTDLNEEYDVGATQFPIYYGGYSRLVGFDILYDYGETKEHFSYPFQLEDFIVMPEWFWNASNNPDVRLKKLGREAKLLAAEIKDLDDVIWLYDDANPVKEELREERAERQRRLTEIATEFAKRIMRERRAYRLPDFDIEHVRTFVDKDHVSHEVHRTDDYQEALHGLETQLELFRHAAVSTFCTVEGQPDDALRALTSWVDLVRLSRQYFESMPNTEYNPADLSRGSYGLHQLRTTPIATEADYLPVQIPKDQLAQIPRSIGDHDLLYRINKSILFSADRPKPDDLRQDAAPFDGILATPEEQDALTACFDEFFDDIGRSAVPLKLIIIGSADKNFIGDSSGRMQYNRDLSERRAQWTDRRFRERVAQRNAEIDASGAAPDGAPSTDGRVKVEIGQGKKLEEILVGWCGDWHAPGDPNDPPQELLDQAHRDVRMTLMTAKDAPSISGHLHQ